MSRKRLLTILAGAVAVIGLQVAPATAVEAELDLGGRTVDASVSEEGVEVGVDDDDGEDGEDGEDGDDEEAEVEVSEDGVDAKAGDEEVSTSDVADDDDGDEPESSDDERSERRSSGGSFSTSGGGVTTAGGARSTGSSDRPAALDLERARQLLPGSTARTDYSARSGGVPGFDLPASEFDDPLIAAPYEQDSDEAADWEPVSPEQERSDAELAAIPAPPDDAVPAGLKLLAGLLVAGTGTLWHLTRRELASPTVARSS